MRADSDAPTARPSPLKKLLAQLNPAQREAVETLVGPVLVLAGAGTGKTRVITYRIANLLANKIPAERILAMTFTNKAAGEMRQRVTEIVGKTKAEGLTVGTFHAFCLRYLRAHLDDLGMPAGFSICDSSDQLALVRSALRELHVGDAQMRPQEALSLISLGKSKLDTPEKMAVRGGDDKDELLMRVWERYQEALKLTRRLDFDDLLTETGRLMRKKHLREEIRDQYRCVLVDEYQDTNGPQFELVTSIAGGHKNLCVVGDDDQSIYGWRGADVSKILGFEKTFPGAKVVKLETNYRSKSPIIRCATKLIANNTGRHEKTLQSALGDGEPIQLLTMRDEETEAVEIVKHIQMMIEHGHHYDDFAILFRTSVQSRAFEAELRLKDVPYSLVGGQSFFDRKEVRDVMAYLRLMVNPKDETSLLRVANSPPRGLGKVTITRLLEHATKRGFTIGDALLEWEQIEGVKEKSVAAVQRMLERLHLLKTMFGNERKDFVEMIRRTIEEVGYREEVDRVYKDEQVRKQRWEAVDEVLNWADNYAKKRKHPKLNKFLDELTLNANDQEDAEDAAKKTTVTLMTLHAAKGLEFPRVFLVGLEEGILPHIKCTETIEEERRLAYVGITRAQEWLQLSWCSERSRAGAAVKRHPSRFLLELQDKEPPEGWTAAGEEPVPAKKKSKKKKKRRSRRSAGQF